MVELTVKIGQEAGKLSIAPKTATGADSTVEPGKTRYVIESGEGTVEQAEDGLSALVKSETVGDVSGRVIGDADPGEPDVPIEDTFLIHFVSPLAENIGLSGEVVPL